MGTKYNDGTRANPVKVPNMSVGCDVAVERDRPVYVMDSDYEVYRVFPSRVYEWVCTGRVEPVSGEGVSR